MGFSCVVPDCKNLQIRDRYMPFHIFPYKHPEIVKLWLEAINRVDLVPWNLSRVCGEHFLPSDYETVRGSTKKQLKWNAVPSVFKPRVKEEVLDDLDHLEHPQSSNLPIVQIKQESLDIHEDYIAKIETNSDTDDQFNPEYVAVEMPKTFVDVAVQAVENNDLVPSLRRKIDMLQQTINKKDKKIASMKGIVRRILKKGYFNKDLDFILRRKN